MNMINDTNFLIKNHGMKDLRENLFHAVVFREVGLKHLLIGSWLL